MNVVIISVRQVGSSYHVYGTVEGEGYRITLPVTDVQGNKGQQQAIIARALKAEYDATHGVPVDLTGTVKM